MEKLSQENGEDRISDLLASLRVSSTVYCRSEMRAPWGFAVQARDVSAFHVVTRGACWLDVDGVDEPMRVEAGDLVLLVSGRGHRVRDALTSTVEWLDDLLERNPPEGNGLRLDGPGPLTELLCGGFEVEGARAHPVLLALPPVLRLRGADAGTAWLQEVLAMLQTEMGRPRPGGDAVLVRLADVMLTQAIRAFLLPLAEVQPSQVRALHDGHIAKVVRLVLADPGRGWRVEDMAIEVAMSRSAFADRFRRVTGEPPMRFVTRCRLSRAASSLAQEETTLLDIALRNGYESEAAFTRAFSRHFGMPPGAYRRRVRGRTPDILVVNAKA